MAQVDVIRNGIIDKLLAISDKEYLLALFRLVDKTVSDSDTIKLTKEQQLMIQLSEKDLLDGKIISQHELDRLDSEWLNEK
jgi:hypothetical protein